MAHFDREEIPERIVHAKGAGAHGTFTVTHDISKYTKADIFSEIGKKTRTFTRFSTVGGERGSADTQRYRLGVNYNALPINKPDVEVNNGFRNGAMRFDDNGADSRNYEPSHYSVPTESPEMAEPPLKIEGDVDRYAYDSDENSDFLQAGNLYRVLSKSEQ